MPAPNRAFTRKRSFSARAFSEWVGITGGTEVVGAFVLGEAIEQLADAVPQAVSSSFWGLAEQRLELGEGHLDRVHIGRVGRQQKELRALLLDGGAHGGDLVGRQIVQRDDVV